MFPEANMKREDKFGRRIYSETVWNRILSTGQRLLTLGYRESRRKPNLFFSAGEQGVFFADLRGTEIVPIWDDQRPLFYWQFERNLPGWKCRRLIKQELLRLGANDCKCRLSFEFDSDPIFESTSMHVDEEALVFDWPDGFCHLCGKDFSEEGWFCSKECELGMQLRHMREEQRRTKCEVCGRHPEIILRDNEYVFKDAFVEHHTDYENNVTLYVCQSCNIKIAKHPEKYPEFLVPRLSRRDFIKNKKKRKETIRQLILRKLMNAKGCMEPELISEVTGKLAVQEDTVKRELRKLLDKKVIEKGLFSDGNLRAVVYYLPTSEKTKPKNILEQDQKQRTLREFSED